MSHGGALEHANTKTEYLATASDKYSLPSFSLLPNKQYNAEDHPGSADPVKFHNTWKNIQHCINSFLSRSGQPFYRHQLDHFFSLS